MTITSSQALGMALCEVLGIDGTNVLSLQLNCNAGDIARLVVESVVDVTAISGIRSAVATYELHQTEPPGMEPTDLW